MRYREFLSSRRPIRYQIFDQHRERVVENVQTEHRAVARARCPTGTMTRCERNIFPLGTRRGRDAAGVETFLDSSTFLAIRMARLGAPGSPESRTRFHARQNCAILSNRSLAHASEKARKASSFAVLGSQTTGSRLRARGRDGKGSWGSEEKNIDGRASPGIARPRSRQRHRNAVTYHLGCCPIVDGLVRNMRAPTMANSLGKNWLSTVHPNAASYEWRKRRGAAALRSLAVPTNRVAARRAHAHFRPLSPLPARF